MSASDGALGALVAAGPRAAGAPSEYALLFEEIRKGYLLHYGEPRLAGGEDLNLALLTGDYLYALGLRKLARLGDLEAVVELADLISLSAQLHAGPCKPSHLAPFALATRSRTKKYARVAARPPERDLLGFRNLCDALWLSTAVAIGIGPDESHGEAKTALRQSHENALELLWESARSRAAAAGISDPLSRAAAQIGFAPRG